MPPRQGGRLDRHQRRSLGERSGTVVSPARIVRSGAYAAAPHRRGRTVTGVSGMDAGRRATTGIMSSADPWLPAPPVVPVGNDSPPSGPAHRSTAIRSTLLDHDSRLRTLDPGHWRARRGRWHRRPRCSRRRTGGRAASGQEPGHGHHHSNRTNASHTLILPRGTDARHRHSATGVQRRSPCQAVRSTGHPDRTGTRAPLYPGPKSPGRRGRSVPAPPSAGAGQLPDCGPDPLLARWLRG